MSQKGMSECNGPSVPGTTFWRVITVLTLYKDHMMGLVITVLTAQRYSSYVR